MTLRQQSTLIQSLGFWLEENQKGKVLSKEKEEKIIQDFQVSEKIFNRIFGHYRKTTELTQINKKQKKHKSTENIGKNQGRRVLEKGTGIIYRSMQECADMTNQKVYILKERIKANKDNRFEFVN